MAARSSLPTEVAKLVIAAVRRVSTRKRIGLDTPLEELHLSAAQWRALLAAIREAVSVLGPHAPLIAAAFAGALKVGDLVAVARRAFAPVKGGGKEPPIRLGPLTGREAPRHILGGATVRKFDFVSGGRGGRAGRTAERAKAARPKPPAGAGLKAKAKKAKSPGPARATAAKRAAAPRSKTAGRGRARSKSAHPTVMKSARNPFTGQPIAFPGPALEAPDAADAPPLAPTPLPATERQINIWIGAGETPLRRALAIGETYRLNFKVGAPVAESFTSGPDAAVPASDIPAGGLPTEWLVVAHDAELAAGTPDTTTTVANIGGVRTWSGRFSLLIPQVGDSAVPQLEIKPLAADPRIEVVITVHGEAYRQFKILLAASDRPGRRRLDPASIADELMPTPTAHIGLSTTHEWTTPSEVLNVMVVGSQAAVQGNAGGAHVDSLEPWLGVQAQVSGPIKNVRDAAEELRAAWESHLDAIDAADLADRLQRWGHGWGGPEYDWGALGDHADDAHRQQWTRMAASAELRKLAQRGQRLFHAFFPAVSNLRNWIAALRPGARLNISWTPLAGAGFIPHVPWGLMYVAEVPPDGQPVDPMGFLGLRCRLAYSSHAAPPASRSLGALDETHRAHFLYWGDGPTDVTGVEARWQRSQWSGWRNQVFVPQTAQNAKAELLRLLNAPQPAPTSVLYLFCQCNTGAGNDPVLRFGGTNDVANVVMQTDFGTSALADRPLVFANACTTAAADPYMANELEEAFFDRNCRAYLGTETKVPIVLGSRFAAIFFHFFYRLLDSAPMAAGEAATQTRLFLWTHYRNIGGLFYSYVNQYDLFLARNDEVLALRR